MEAKKGDLVPQRISRLQELVDILDRDGEVGADELASEMGIPKKRIYNLISHINLRCLSNPEKYPHVYTTGMGYTITRRVESSVYEAGKRMKNIYGIWSRGVPAFAHCKIARPQYYSYLKVEYNPSGEKLNRILENQKSSRKKITKQ